MTTTSSMPSHVLAYAFYNAGPALPHNPMPWHGSAESFFDASVGDMPRRGTAYRRPVASTETVWLELWNDTGAGRAAHLADVGIEAHIVRVLYLASLKMRLSPLSSADVKVNSATWHRLQSGFFADFEAMAARIIAEHESAAGRSRLVERHIFRAGDYGDLVS